MLKTVLYSTAKKTGGCAVTYRAASNDLYGTCPNTCALKPAGKKSAQSIDLEYFDALINAVPKKGLSFTYTHFNPELWVKRIKPEGSVINFSADTVDSALKALHSHKVPVTVVVNRNFWPNKKSKLEKNTWIVRCPAELRPNSVTCRNCGNGRPLCARHNRPYIIGFTAHGTAAAAAENPNKSGGCYASSGNVSIHWIATSKNKSTDSDGKKLQAFVRALPIGSVIRHHVAGDIGH